MIAPFPWFGGKSKAASLIWQRLGNVPNYVEPFAGSLAVLLNRPHDPGIETVNDLDGYISNFWRALQHDPDEVARWADWPVNENDLHARHIWLVNQKADFTRKLEGDPDYYDTKIAGWWVWGICSWIGHGWCSGQGPWQVAEVDGSRQLIHLGNAGLGVNRQRVHLGDAGQGVNRQLVHLGDAGQGVNRKRVHLGDAGQGVNRKHQKTLTDYFQQLADRLRRVRVACGDWTRVCGPTPTFKNGLTGILLDPPYSVDDRAELYNEESFSVAHDVREWAIANGDNPLIRIALCGYEGEHAMQNDWECMEWHHRGGYGNQSRNGNDNRKRERIWFSPHCLKPQTFKQQSLLDNL